MYHFDNYLNQFQVQFLMNNVNWGKLQPILKAYLDFTAI